ncbi:MAG: hypothetical protein CVV23_04845 [Ignavibacteriae bacterium HGW-Ignavibacteriae-2]|jgi:hypothetical protein|nr:MAG: hypothetical protein CVV23_04845 [Ignavibacteriae bacterium HGW-Ignavibacteriae-2]
MLILTVAISISLNAQQPLNTKNAAVELYMGTEDVSPASKFITFKLDAESPVIGATKVSI